MSYNSIFIFLFNFINIAYDLIFFLKKSWMCLSQKSYLSSKLYEIQCYLIFILILFLKFIFGVNSNFQL